MKMKNLAKVLAISFVALVLLVSGVVAFFFGFNQNSLISRKLTNDLKSQIMDNGSFEIVDSVSVCGKLVGNGNGMQFYGAVLVESDSETDISEFVDSLDSEFEVVGYCFQTDSQIKTDALHGHFYPQYENFPKDGKTYYTIYYFNSNHKYSTDFDIRAH